MQDDKLKIIFVNYGPYYGCSGVHIHFLANALVALGHECFVFLPNIEGATEHFGKTNYEIHNFTDLLELPLHFFEGAVLHVWTTRETARVPVTFLQKRIKLPYLVHLEDHEVLITAKKIGVDTLEEQKIYAKNNPQAFDKFLETHPLHFEPFMRSSAGVTCIIKTLEEFVPEGVPRMTFWPACEEDFFNLPRTRNEALRKACEIEDNTYVLVYPGAIHEHNVHYFLELLFALDQLSQEGIFLKIVRSGIEFDKYTDEQLDLYKKYVIYVEDLNAEQLPRLMTFADFLVQPGAPRGFDDYRFPSKTPFFLASGRPLILPNTNVAEKLKHGLDCFLMNKGDAEEIVKYLKILIQHPALAEKMGAQGRATARALFSWENSAKSLVPFYKNALIKKMN